MENVTVALQQQSNKTYNDEYMELSDAIKQIKEQTGDEIDKEEVMDYFADENNKISRKEINRYCQFVTARRESFLKTNYNDFDCNKVY